MPQNDIYPPQILRRSLVIGAASTALSAGVRSHTLRPLCCRADPGETVHLAQLLDSSQVQHEVSRDYLTGLRLAANEFNRTSRRRIQLVAFQSDGSAASLKSVMASVRKDASLAGFVGTAGERLSLDSIQTARAEGLTVAHLSPWMFDSRFDADRDVISLFASLEAQIRFALQSLESLGIMGIGVVYSSSQAFAALRRGVESASKLLKLRAVAGYLAGRYLFPILARGWAVQPRGRTFSRTSIAGRPKTSAGFRSGSTPHNAAVVRSSLRPT